MDKVKKFAVAMAADPRTWIVVATVLQPALAQAYLGQTMVVGLYKMVGLPVIFIAFVWAVISLLFNQQHVSRALYTLLAGIVVTGLIFAGDMVMGWVSAAQSEAR